MTGHTALFFGGPLDGTKRLMEETTALVVYEYGALHYEYTLEVRGSVENVRSVYVYQGESMKEMEGTA